MQVRVSGGRNGTNTRMDHQSDPPWLDYHLVVYFDRPVQAAGASSGSSTTTIGFGAAGQVRNRFGEVVCYK